MHTPEITTAVCVNVVTVDAVGVRVGIDIAALDSAGRDAVLTAWRSARVIAPASSDAVVVPDAAVETGEMLARLSGTVTRAAIEAQRGDRWMLHAGGLADARGRVVVLVGPSGAGKTTATKMLARRWGYVSDETIGIDGDGTVHTYRKPLSLITDGFGFKVQRAPEDLGLQPLPAAPLRLARLILLERRDDPQPARLVPVSADAALAELAVNSSALAKMDLPLRTIMRLIERTGEVLRAQYSEAGDLVSLIDGLDLSDLSTGDDDHRSTTAHDGRHSKAVAYGVESFSGLTAHSMPRYRRTPFVDWCWVDDHHVAVLTAGNDGNAVLRMLAGVAPELWLRAEDATYGDLVAAVSLRYDCPEPAVVTSKALAALVDAGLLSLTV